MDTARTCSTCGKPLAPSAPEGLCPECLLKAGLGTGVDIGPDTGGKAPRFVPPKIEELAAKFPQLKILEFIGQGGMGAVYKARQKQLDRIVALKILPPQAGGPAFAERFTREARALAKLNHPHIVTLYEFGQSDGLFYFLMEFVNGVNLRQLLSNSRIASREALAIVPQICEALQFAHDSGIVHRDIKPENILLDKKGLVKIADFGVAKIIAESLTDAAEKSGATPGELTEAGSTLGTPQYMAPEQIRNSAEVDHRADIYSLGVVFYQMLTGELPSGKIEPPSRKVHIDVRLDEVVLRALEKKPELRFQQVSDVKTLVETIVTTPPPPPANPPAPFKRYKDSKWNFELDVPEDWGKFPPVRENSIDELIRFGSHKNGRHLLILFLKRQPPSQSLSKISDGVQKVLANVGFGNFVSRETTLNGKPARILDFDRPEGNNTWSCREYFVAEGELLYILGFGTNNKAAMFETFDHMSKSFQFQTTSQHLELHELAMKPFFPKTETMAGGTPPEPGFMTAADLPSEGYRSRIEPMPEASRPKPASPVRKSLWLAWSLAVIAMVITTLIALYHQTASPIVLSETDFLQKFDSNQISQATIVYGPTGTGGMATITGRFLKTDADGKPVEENGHLVEEKFVTPNVVLTSTMENKLLTASNVSISLPNPIVRDVGSQLLVFLLIGIAAFLVLFIITLAIYFGVRAGRSLLNDGSLPPPQRHSGIKFLPVAVVVVLGATFFLCVVNVVPSRSGPSAAGQRSIPFHVRVFLADASVVDQLIPASERRSGMQPNVQSVKWQGPTNQTPSQIAFASPAIVNSLVQTIPATTGLLIDRTRLVSSDWWFPGLADSWSYSISGKVFFGGGGATAWLGVREKNGATQVRIDSSLDSDIMPLGRGTFTNINSRILFEGPPPQDNGLVFLVPFQLQDGTAHYLVTVFNFNKQTSEATAGLALPGPPFMVQLPSATVELACIGDQPWTNTVCWYPNGRLSPTNFPIDRFDPVYPSSLKKVLFYLSTSTTNGISMPVCITKDSSGDHVQGSFWMPPHGRNQGYFGVELVCPSNTLTANLFIAMADGPWETVISMEHAPATTSGVSTSGGWTGRYEVVKGSNGDIALGCSYSTTSNWVSRMVYVNGRGDIVPIKETSSDYFGNPDTATLLLSSNEYANIKTFLVQRRKLQWVEFDNVSLQQGHLTQVSVQGNGVSLPSPQAAASATAGQTGSKRQRFVPVTGAEEKTSWGVENHSEFNTNGWVLTAKMTLGGTARIQPWMINGNRPPPHQSPNDDVLWIKLVAGDDDAVTLNVKDLKANNNLTLNLSRDQWTDITVNGTAYRIGYCSVWVAPDQPDTTSYAQIVLTRTAFTELPFINPGMEQGTNTPDGWEEGTQVPGVEQIWDFSTAHSGNASLRLQKTVPRYFPIAQWSQEIAVAPEDHPRKLRVRCWIKAKNVTKAIVDVNYQNESDGHVWAIYVGQKTAADPLANFDWKLCEGTVEVPAHVTSIGIAFEIYGPGTIWFDDLDVAWQSDTSIN